MTEAIKQINRPMHVHTDTGKKLAAIIVAGIIWTLTFSNYLLKTADAHACENFCDKVAFVTCALPKRCADGNTTALPLPM